MRLSIGVTLVGATLAFVAVDSSKVNAATCTAGVDCVAGTIYSPAPNPIGAPPPAVSTWTVSSPADLIASYWAFGDSTTNIPNFPNQGAATIQSGVAAWIGFDPGASVGAQTYSGSTGGTLTLGTGVTANIFALHWDSQEMVLVYDVSLSSFTISGLDQNLSGITAFSDCTDTSCATAGGHSTGTPIPGALPLFASGAGLLGFFGWRRKRKQTI
jgi:hypothetical protein